MLQIKEKKDCCGCSACEQACPKSCIRFDLDNEGFLYPSINLDRCIDCGLCERVCPVINQGQRVRPLQTFAAFNKEDSVRKESSSGGVFTKLSESVLNDGGCVYGAAFDDDWAVSHVRVSSFSGLSQLRGSKYIQSRLGDTFKQVKSDLNNGLKVLFSGTPCQVAGLRNYLRKEYDNLLTVDTVCHGVPGPGVWNAYLDGMSLEKTQIDSVSMRAKPEGWQRYHVQISDKKGNYIVDEPFSENHYMTAFLHNYSMRPACYDCPSKCGRSGSDITLGDFWGIRQIDPAIDDDKGLNLLMVNTEKGRTAIERIDINRKVERYEDALKHNPSIESSVRLPKYRKLFMKRLEKYGFNSAYKLLFSKNILTRIRRKVWLKFN